MTYYRVCNKSNKTGVTSGAGTAYLCGWVHPRYFVGVCVAQSFSSCRSLFITIFLGATLTMNYMIA